MVLIHIGLQFGLPPRDEDVVPSSPLGDLLREYCFSIRTTHTQIQEVWRLGKKKDLPKVLLTLVVSRELTQHLQIVSSLFCFTLAHEPEWAFVNE